MEALPSSVHVSPDVDETSVLPLTYEPAVKSTTGVVPSISLNTCAL